jgi:hypothetical protein
MPTLVVSYSRQDQRFVRSMVKTLQAAIGVKDAVFWDDDFEPGEPWFQQLTKAIDQARQLFVFWCVHAAASEQVRREYEYALSIGAKVIPLLLDGAFESGPAFVRDVQGIDFRGLTQHSDDSLYDRNPTRQPPYSTQGLLQPPGGAGSGDRRWGDAKNRLYNLLQQQSDQGEPGRDHTALDAGSRLSTAEKPQPRRNRRGRPSRSRD